MAKCRNAANNFVGARFGQICQIWLDATPARAGPIPSASLDVMLPLEQFFTNGNNIIIQRVCLNHKTDLIPQISARPKKMKVMHSCTDGSKVNGLQVYIIKELTTRQEEIKMQRITEIRNSEVGNQLRLNMLVTFDNKVNVTRQASYAVDLVEWHQGGYEKFWPDVKGCTDLGPNYKKILRLSYDVIITYDNRKSNLR